MVALLAEHLEAQEGFESPVLTKAERRAHLRVIEKEAAPMAAIKAEPSATVHKTVFKLLAVVNAAILGVFAITFNGDAGALFMVAISAVYLAAYLGTPYVLNRVGAIEDEDTQDFAAFLKKPFDTWTGEISGAEALTQILLVPGAILIAVTAMGLIIGANQ